MLAGWLVQDHLTQGHLTWCPRLRNSWERECLVAGAWRVSRTLGGGEPCKRAWVGCWMCKAVQHVLCLCGVVCHRLPRTVARSCRAGLPKHSSCRPFVQPCCVGSFVSVVARGIPLPRRGPVSTCYAGYLLCWAVSARPDSPLSSCRAGPSAQGSLNAPDWLAGQHADRAWPTRRRGIRMPWWCWPAGRSPCCSPRQWPPGNESPCLILRQR